MNNNGSLWSIPWEQEKISVIYSKHLINQSILKDWPLQVDKKVHASFVLENEAACLFVEDVTS